VDYSAGSEYPAVDLYAKSNEPSESIRDSELHIYMSYYQFLKTNTLLRGVKYSINVSLSLISMFNLSMDDDVGAFL
jgi:hypothetical protein